MLLGNESFLDGLKTEIRNVEAEKGFRVVYAGVVGSLSRDISDTDSDYDIKCLFMREELFSGDLLHDEGEIRYRKFLPEKAYNCIAFWEIAAFLNFLAEPYIDRGSNYELFKNCLWLLTTPYAWDPYGIQSKLGRYIDLCFQPRNEMVWDMRIMDVLLESRTDGEQDVLRLAHAMLSVKWMERYGTLPPLSIYSLLPLAREEGIYEDVLILLSYMYRDVSACDGDEKGRLDACCLNVEDAVRGFCERNMDLRRQSYDFSLMGQNREWVSEMWDIVGCAVRNPVVERLSGEIRI